MKNTTTSKFLFNIHKQLRGFQIVILQQDKGRGVVILNLSRYIAKCLSIVNSGQVLQVDKDPTAYIERKVYRTLRKIKDKILSLFYSNIYPTGSSPGRFYGTFKLHKIKDKGTINGLTMNLPLRPIISNIGTATYELVNCNTQSKVVNHLWKH